MMHQTPLIKRKQIKTLSLNLKKNNPLNVYQYQAIIKAKIKRTKFKQKMKKTSKKKAMIILMKVTKKMKAVRV